MSKTYHHGDLRTQVLAHAATMIARDGAEALEHLHRRGVHADAVRPDLIILDLNLPRRSGHEVLADLKEHPDLRRIPVAVLTTSSSERDVLQSYDLGANCYLTKPVDFKELSTVLMAFMDPTDPAKPHAFMSKKRG